MITIVEIILSILILYSLLCFIWYRIYKKELNDIENRLLQLEVRIGKLERRK